MNAKFMIGLMALAGVAALTGCAKEPLVAPDTQVTAAGKAPTVNLDSNEIEIVEKMAEHRMAYKAYLEALQSYYVKHGMYDKQVWAEKELNDYRKGRKYTYLVLTDLPASALVKPTDKVAEADVMYEDAMNYFKEGKIVPGVLNDKGKLRLALEKFDTLIKQYPNSDKVDDALFYAGEILKEYFDENDKACEYYKRAYEADPNTPHPAHFQRAVVLDYRLHNRDEALKEYEAVLKFETGKPFFWSKSNSDFAASRSKELKGEK
ncbi:MAG: tetratricopeptide repeat protein [Phycisphaerae bacterium]|nr:tetratricopeptide repeat protein [Phycisphaerae bacterium]